MPLPLPSKFKPVIGESSTTRYLIREIHFGDGYKHISPAGINNKRRSLSLIFRGLTEADKEELVDFLDNLGGMPFTIQPAGESTPITVYTKEISFSTIGGNRFDLTCTVESLYGVFS